MSDAKRVLYIFATLPIGGAEEHLKTVVLNLKPYGFTPVVCCIGDKGVIGEEIEAAGVSVITLEKMKGKGFDPMIIKDISTLIKREGIDIVHTHLYHANMYGRSAALAARVPVVATEHNVYKSYKKKRSIINRLLAKKTDKMIAVSRAVKDEICARDSIAPAKVEVIYNGIEVDRFKVPSAEEKSAARVKLALDPKAPVIGTISRLSKQKGHTFLLKAFAELLASFPDLRLLIVGSGPLDEELRSEARELAIEENIIFTGARRDVPEVLKAIDIFAMPSLWEGFPVSLLEAFATGLPVVATPVGGVADAIERNLSGLLVEPEDVQGLKYALTKLLEDKEFAASLGKEARAVVEDRFSVTTMLDSMTSLYKDILEKRKA